ncbi:MAG: hypothetical protein JWM81_563 [Candidatus Saccharibacteria bacterium]|nr:hypothetical protein [Candidatus Saccharibacteria bacterium]
MAIVAGAELWQDLIDSRIVIEPDGQHTELSSGMHGQKVVFGNIEPESGLYHKWIGTVCDYMQEQYAPLPRILVSVADGTNRPVTSIVERFGDRMIGLHSQKDPRDPERLFLGSTATAVLMRNLNVPVVVKEDTSTTGGKSGQVAKAIRNAGVRDVSVLTTVQRRDTLEVLDEAEIPYRAIIKAPMPTYTPEDCLRTGFCSMNWLFKPRKGAPYRPLDR